MISREQLYKNKLFRFIVIPLSLLTWWAICPIIFFIASFTSITKDVVTEYKAMWNILKYGSIYRNDNH